MSSAQLDIDRLREKLPRSYKALVQLYPVAWDQMLGVVDEAMQKGATASVVTRKFSILRGLERSTRRWVMLSIAADRREIMLREQKSFLTPLHDRSLKDLLAEIERMEARSPGETPAPPTDDLPRGFVFVSHHAASEGALALALAEELEKTGLSCWLAPRDIRPGEDWNDEVYGASQRCGALVFLYSKPSAKSRHVKGEIHIAVGRGIPIVVVKLAEGDPAAVNIGLATYQHLDWSIGGDANALSRAIAKAFKSVTRRAA